MTREERKKRTTWLKAFALESEKPFDNPYTSEQLDQLAEELDEESITDDSVLTTGI